MTAAGTGRRLWCPECFSRLGRALLVWAGVITLVRRRRAIRTRRRT